MAGKKGNKDHANSTSYPNQKMNKKEPRIIYRKLIEIMENAIADESISSWQKACLSIGWRVTKMNYWCDKIPVFLSIKEEICQIILSRINDGALNSKYNSTASIWRMKMLGEYEVQKVEQTVNSNIDIVIDGEEF